MSISNWFVLEWVCIVEVEKKVKDILDNKLNEKPSLDYKFKEYDLNSEKDKFELIKDVIAMLNTEEAFIEDKYILMGVVEKPEVYAKGLDEQMKDDNEYQHVFDSIKPRPKVETGNINYNDKNIGYIYIRKENYNRSYTSWVKSPTNSSGISFIRKGTTNVSLDDKTREKLILKKYDNQAIDFSPAYGEILKHNEIKNKLFYSNENTVGKIEINPDNNDGLFTIGAGIKEFRIKFEVANNEIARIYNDEGIQIAKLQNKAFLLTENINQKDIEHLDFTSRCREYKKDDLAVIVNKMGKIALITFQEINSKVMEQKIT